jgi:hypothetical protein
MFQMQRGWIFGPARQGAGDGSDHLIFRFAAIFRGIGVANS